MIKCVQNECSFLSFLIAFGGIQLFFNKIKYIRIHGNVSYFMLSPSLLFCRATNKHKQFILHKHVNFNNVDALRLINNLNKLLNILFISERQRERENWRGGTIMNLKKGQNEK